MARRTFTKVLVALGLLFNTAQAVRAQLTFSMSPNVVTATTGDTVNIDILVNGFTTMNSFQFTIEWDPTILAPVRPATGMSTPTVVDNVNMPDGNQFAYNALASNNALTAGWNANGSAKTITNGQRIFRMRLKAIAPSTNYWAKFSSRFVAIEAEQVVSGSPRFVTPTFIPLGTPPGTTVTPVTLTGGTVSTTVNQRVCVPVTANDFTNIISSGWTNRWTPTSLRYEEVTNFNTTLGLTAANFTPNASAGTLTFAKTYTTAQTLPAATKLFDVCYTALAVGSTSVSFESATLTKQVNGVSSTATTSLSAGTVNISPAQSSSNLSFVVGSTTVSSGTKASVKVKVGTFTNIASVQFSMRFDSTKMLFDSVRSTVLNIDTVLARGGNNGNFNNGFSRPLNSNFWTGTLNFVWIDGQGVNRSLPDSTTLFEMFFTYIGASNTCTPVSILGLPVSIACGREDGARVIPTIVNGSVCRTGVTTPLTVVPTVRNVTCPGGNDGSITLAVSGGSGSYLFNWGAGVTTQDRTGLTAGTYSVTISAGSDSRVETFQLTQPSAFVLTPTVVNVGCSGGTDGSISIAATGGTAPYTYEWLGSNGRRGTNDTLLNLKAGTYNLTVTDSRRCAQTYLGTVTEPANGVTIGSRDIVGTRCASRTGSITLQDITGGNGGNTFSWEGPSFTATTRNISNLVAGNYNLTITDSRGCKYTPAVFVVVDTPSSITLSTPSVTNATCNGAQNGSIANLTASGTTGAVTYAWTGPNNFTSTDLNISNLFAGDYTLTVRDGGTCPATRTVTVTQPEGIRITTFSKTDVKCKSGTDGTITLFVTGGASAQYNYEWRGPNFTSSNQSLTGLAAGKYVVIIKDNTNCEKRDSITVGEPDLLAITGTVTDVTCNDQNNGAISLSVVGGTQPYSYSWTGPVGTSNQKDLTGQRAGTGYKVDVTDGNRCVATATYEIKQPAPLSITASTTDATGSPNGSITLSISGGNGGETYSWSGTGVNPTAKDQTGLCSGTYNVTVTDSKGCNATRSVTIGGACSATLSYLGSERVNAGCVGQNLGSIVINWTGGTPNFTVTWYRTTSTAPYSTQNVNTRTTSITGLPAGIYYAVISDNSLPTKQTIESLRIEVAGNSAPLSIGVGIGNETCAGGDGSITLSVTNGAAPYNYRWADITSDVSVRRNLQAGFYNVSIRDANGCIRDTNMIAVPRTACLLSATTQTTDPTCFGGEDGKIRVNISNGEPAYKIQWAGPKNGSIDNISTAGTRAAFYEITRLLAGNYTITVTDTVSGRQQLLTATITPPPMISISKTISPATSGNNGSIVLSVQGGTGALTYRWNNGSTSRDLFNLPCGPTVYTVTVTDSKECQSQTGVDTVACSFGVLAFKSSVISQPLCKNDSTNWRVIVTIEGGSPPYMYEWRNERGQIVATTNELNNANTLSPGRYTVLVKDNQTPARTISQDYFIRVESTLGFNNLQTADADDNSSATGKCSFDILPGDGPYFVTWGDGSPTVQVPRGAGSITQVSNTSLKVGAYTATVIDGKGCKFTVPYTINSKKCVTLRMNSDTIPCNGACTGQATIVDQSSLYKAPFRFVWSNGETGLTAQKLCSGLQNVVLTDANGATCKVDFNLKEPAKIGIDIKIDRTAKCLDAVVTGGVAPYTYRWTTPKSDITRKVCDLKTGSYLVLVQDTKGCSVVADTFVVFDKDCLTGALLISPNDDGKNDNFLINTSGCSYKTIRLEVYNRWGTLVFAKDDYRNSWQGNDQDGTAGKPLADGIYMYVIKGTNDLGQLETVKGTVTIVRE
jgi:gliding motility-associated-like protein